MVKTPPLSAEQLKDLKLILEQRHDLLQKQESLDLGNLVKAANERVNEKREEFSAPRSADATASELSERHNAEMHGIEHAFIRIHQGTYGICSDCQSNIDFPRLLAYPTALRCMTCQETYELSEKRRHR
jgi:DnaK suppressor protein